MTVTLTTSSCCDAASVVIFTPTEKVYLSYVLKWHGPLAFGNHQRASVNLKEGNKVTFYGSPELDFNKREGTAMVVLPPVANLDSNTLRPLFFLSCFSISCVSVKELEQIYLLL